jgi:hypothetical protein
MRQLAVSNVAACCRSLRQAELWMRHWHVSWPAYSSAPTNHTLLLAWRRCHVLLMHLDELMAGTEMHSRVPLEAGTTLLYPHQATECPAVHRYAYSFGIPGRSNWQCCC